MANLTARFPRERLALYVLQAGAIAVVLAALPYKSFDLDRYFVPKELVLHVCATLAAVLCISLRDRLTLAAVDVLLVCFLVVSAVSASVAINPWTAQRAFAISFSSALLFWVASALRRSGYVRSLTVALAIAVVLGAATSLAQAYGVETQYFSINRAPGGTFGNRNSVAHLAAIGMPVVLLVALTARRNVGSLAGAFGIAVLSAALVLSRSRGAWLAVIVLGGVVATLGVVCRAAWVEPRTMRRVLVVGIGAALGAGAAIVLPNTLQWNSDSPYLDSAAGLVNYKEGSGHGRLVQYTTSLRMTAGHPLLGVGPGNWPVVYPKFARKHDPSMSQEDGLTSNPWPSSDWVAYLSERGGIGSGLLLLAMIGLLVRAVRDLRRGSGDPERVLTAIALIGTLAAVAVVGAFDAVLLVATPAFFVWTLAGVLAPPKSGGVTIGTGVREFGPVIVFALGAVMIVRSASQVTAMALYSSSQRTAVLTHAERFDPGSYRIRVRLAQAYIARGDCKNALAQARAIHALFPSAGQPKREIRACGGK